MELSQELFTVPFLAGLGFALLLPVLGCYLRLRDEWLGALAYPHVAAAGALLAMPLGLPLALGGGLTGAGAALAKRLLARGLGAAASYAVLLIFGWAGSVLLTANLPMAERMGHALFDGQLYFADGTQLALAWAWSVPALAVLAGLSRQLLLARVYPDLFRLRQRRGWLLHLAFDLVSAGSLALATMTLGVLGVFALVFVPPWAAFRLGQSWRKGLAWALLGGAAAYCLAFFLALRLDQPFGPVLAMVLVGAAGPFLLLRHDCVPGAAVLKD